MKKTYIIPQSQQINLFLEGEVALTVTSNSESNITDESDYLSNRKGNQTIWGGNEEKKEGGIWQ